MRTTSRGHSRSGFSQRPVWPWLPSGLAEGVHATLQTKAWREAGSDLATAKELSRIIHVFFFFLSLRGSRATHRPAECSVNSQREPDTAKTIRSTASGDGGRTISQQLHDRKAISTGFLRGLVCAVSTGSSDMTRRREESWLESDQTRNCRRDKESSEIRQAISRMLFLNSSSSSSKWTYSFMICPLNYRTDQQYPTEMLNIETSPIENVWIPNSERVQDPPRWKCPFFCVFCGISLMTECESEQKKNASLFLK